MSRDHRAESLYVGIACGVLLLSSSALPAAEPSLEGAFIFGSRNLSCPVPNAPGATYRVVLQIDGQPLSIAYPDPEIQLAAGQAYPDPSRTWGYEIIYSGGAVVNDPNLPAAPLYNGLGDWLIYGAMDNSANGRTKYPDTCPEQIYDSFIGGKNFLTACNPTVVGNAADPCSTVMDPDGVIFRVDVPNGYYRFVMAVGDADNMHSHRVLAEDGGEGPPGEIGPDHVVLVDNFLQAHHPIGQADATNLGEGVFAQVGFGGKLPPQGDGISPSPVFVNMDENGRETACPPQSPVLRVTQGYVRIHCLQANASAGPTGLAADPNGGDLVVLECWRFDAAPTVVPAPSLTRTFAPAVYAPGADITVTLRAGGIVGAATLEETVPAGLAITNAGGGAQAGNVLTFALTADATITYSVKAPASCVADTFTGTLRVPAAACNDELVLASAPACDPGPCGILGSGGVRDFLVIGPIDAGRNTSPVANNCSDNASAEEFAEADYLDDGRFDETSILVEEGDDVAPDWEGAARGIGVKFAPNPEINPSGGVLTVWRARADATGMVNFNAPGYLQAAGAAGDPLVDDFVIYCISYIENTTGECLPVILEVGSDDAVKVRLNGQLLLANIACRGVPAYGAGDRVPAVLTPGVNVVLLAVVERGGGTNARLVIRDADDVPITDGRVRGTCAAPVAYPPLSDLEVTRSFSPVSVTAPESGILTVTLAATSIRVATTIADTFPADFEVVDAGGGQVAGNQITFDVSANGNIVYTLRLKGNPEICPFVTGSFVGFANPQGGCGRAIAGPSSITCTTVCLPTPESEAAELVEAFIFGGAQPVCPTYNDPGREYTVVDQVAGQPLSIAYPDPDIQLAAGQFYPDEGRSWGYEILYSNGTVVNDPALPAAIAGYNVGTWNFYGPMDDTPNGDRNEFPDTCPEEIYDSFIGAKNWLDLCDQTVVGDTTSPCEAGGLAPDGVIFRVDVPNGKYRFVLAAGSANNNHAHRVLAEDGGAGLPSEIGPNHVVLVSNFDQAQYDIGTTGNANMGNGVYAQVGFGDKIPPPGDGVAPSPQFVPMDASGLATVGCPSSPTLEVTQGYVRIHCLQANANAGPGGARDANGGDLVVLELWRVEGTGPGKPVFRRGDADASDGVVNITDAIFVLNYLFQGGSEPPCLDAADADNEFAINITDGIYILSFLFLGGPEPPLPGPITCGPEPDADPAADGLDCKSYPPEC